MLHPVKKYLDFVIDTKDNLNRFEVKTLNGNYTIVIYKAIELDPVYTFICVHKEKKNKSYYLISNNIIDWGNNCKLPTFIKKYCERLLKLSTFI